MRPPSSLLVSLFILSLPYITRADNDPLLPCAYVPDDRTSCNEPIDAVNEILPGSYYVVKLKCFDCPVLKVNTTGPDRQYYLSPVENDLFFNISLSHDLTTLFVNQNPMLPLSTIAHSVEPYPIYTPQIAPNFSRADLDTSLACPKDHPPDRCRSHDGRCFCIEPTISLSPVALDFDYGATETTVENGKVEWEVTIDAIGGRYLFSGDSSLPFNHSRQQMLRMVVQGSKIEEEDDLPDLQAGSTLFGPFREEKEARYELQIKYMELVERSYAFSAPQRCAVWCKVKHFFGYDPKPPANHFIYLQDEWSAYGKKGTLKNELGIIIHEWWWDLVFIIAGSVVGGLVVLYGLYRLVLVILEQRRLAQWGGMDEVWRQIREGDDEEGLLDGGYRDDPEDTQPLYYTDEVPVDKPLPSKPLPEKPLPDVPLIDDI